MSIDTSSIELEDPLAWAKVSEIHSSWVRDVGPQYGIDVPKYLLGDVLSTIIGDDANCFGIKCAQFNPDLAELGKESLLIRLRWEIDTEETPEDIREKLQKFLSIAEQTNWLNEDTFIGTRDAWYKKVRNFVKHQIALNKSYRDAINYEFDMDKILHPEYKELLFGTQK